MNPQPYNFRKPGRLASDLEQSLAAWLRGACALAPAKWVKELPFRADMGVTSLETVRPGDALARLPEPASSYRVLLPADGTNTLLALSRPLMLGLITGILGEALTELPADRELTMVEESLAEYLLQVLFLAVLQETWPGRETLSLRLGQAEPRPRFARIFAPEDNVVLCAFTLRAPFGEQSWYWLLPQKALQEQFTQFGPGLETEQGELVRPRLEGLVHDLPVEVAVALGAVELSLSQLAKLRAGDVVILDQRVSEPLTVRVAGRKKLRVWPGRVGSQQAFQIESLLEC
jgi:flagellar motor switch protein FliM